MAIVNDDSKSSKDAVLHLWLEPLHRSSQPPVSRILREPSFPVIMEEYQIVAAEGECLIQEVCSAGEGDIYK